MTGTLLGFLIISARVMDKQQEVTGGLTRGIESGENGLIIFICVYVYICVFCMERRAATANVKACVLAVSISRNLKERATVTIAYLEGDMICVYFMIVEYRI